MEKKLKILMLEDSPFDAEIIQQFLKQAKLNFESRVVMTEDEFVETLDSFQPDLILSDNTLPQFSATEALEIFHSRSLSIPFILVTGTVSEEFAAGIIKLGADDYILKDRLTRLPGAIDAALHKKKTEAAIRHSEETRKLIMNSALDAIICIDEAGLITVWNPQAEKLFGWEEAEMIGRNLTDTIIPEPYRAAHTAGLDRYLKTGQGRIINRVVEVSALNRGGDEFPIELAIVPIKQAGEDFFCAFIRDISERRKAEEQIRFRADLLNTVGQAVVVKNINGSIIYWNNAAEKIYGWKEEAVLGKNVLDLIPDNEGREQAIDVIQKLSEGNYWSGEVVARRKDGTSFPAYAAESPIYNKLGQVTGIIGVSADITEQKKTEATLMAMEKKIFNQKIQEQKKISRAIIKAQEEEKNHIGQELHDNINQILAGTKMYLSVEARKDESVKEILRYPIELIQSSIEEIRLLSSKQVTPLKDLNLEEMIRGLVHNNNSDGLPVMEYQYSVDDQHLSDDLKLNIYRIMQEQVNNILKHAEASKVRIQLNSNDNAIRIVVADDGKGFNPDARRKGIGISNILNRIESFNGNMIIQSSPGNGCTTSVTIPY